MMMKTSIVLFILIFTGGSFDVKQQRVCFFHLKVKISTSDQSPIADPNELRLNYSAMQCNMFEHRGDSLLVDKSFDLRESNSISSVILIEYEDGVQNLFSSSFAVGVSEGDVHPFILQSYLDDSPGAKQLLQILNCKLVFGDVTQTKLGKKTVLVNKMGSNTETITIKRFQNLKLVVVDNDLPCE